MCKNLLLNRLSPLDTLDFHIALDLILVACTNTATTAATTFTIPLAKRNENQDIVDNGNGSSHTPFTSQHTPF